MKEKIIIFTDGASRGNPGPGGWGAIVADVSKGEIFEIGGRKEKTTNNVMEMTASIEVLKRIKNKEANINLYTDSSYLINGITKWVRTWQENGWKTKDKKDVLNKNLWQKLLKEVSDREVSWLHVEGHAGIAGNMRADEIATNFADKKPLKLYRGKISEYGTDIFDLKQTKKKLSKKRNSGKAYSYISEVRGKIMIHKTWKETEERVKGRKARFKKALSKEDENKIIKEFQVDS